MTCQTLELILRHIEKMAFGTAAFIAIAGFFYGLYQLMTVTR